MWVTAVSVNGLVPQQCVIFLEDLIAESPNLPQAY